MTRTSTNPFNPKIVNLCESLARAQRQCQERPPAESREELEKILLEAGKLGLAAPDVLWALAVVNDNLGDLPAALGYCKKALQFDPLSVSYRQSWAIIVRRLTEAVLDESRPLDDPEPLALCRLLASHGAADEAVHTRHARLLLGAGNVAEARAVLEAVLKLSPGSPEALAVLAEIAAAANDDELAGRVRAAAMRSAQLDLPLALTQPEAQA